MSEHMLPLLEKRMYMHGTTLFDTLCALYNPGEHLVFKVSHMILSNTVAITDASEETTESPAAATLSWHTPGQTREIAVRPLPLADPIERGVYDEERIVATGEWRPGCIHARPPEDESMVRCAVALHKALLKHEVPHTDPGQWLFTRLELPKPLTPGRELTVTLRQKFGAAAALSDLANEHGPIGSIFFSWLKKS